MPAPHACGPPSPSEWHHPTGWEVADVFRLYGPDYQRRYAISATQERVITDIIACRTAQLGGHAEPCPNCRFERFAYNSCRNRHCPKCQTFAQVKWLQARQAELLPVPYVHAVFTLPHALNGLIQAHPRQLLSMLFQSVGQTLKQFGRNQLGGQLGATLILHTWDQTLGAHVHLHCLIPASVLDEPGDSWVPSHPHFLFSVHALSEVFRGKFVEALNQAHDQRQLEVGTTAGSRSDREDFASLLDRLYAHQWVVYNKAPFAKPQQVLDYLGRYTHRVAMSNHRLVELTDGQVRFMAQSSPRRPPRHHDARGSRVYSPLLVAYFAPWLYAVSKVMWSCLSPEPLVTDFAAPTTPHN
jgi:hypothetical protein